MKPYWNRRLFTVLIVCFAATLPAALAQSIQWTPFSSQEFRFSASFCGVPSEDPPSVETQGTRTGTTRLFKARGENYFCMAGVSDYNFKPDVEAEVLLNETNFIKAINGTLVTTGRTEFANAPEKLPALTFTFDMPPNYTGKSIVILKGSRVYQLIFAYRKSMDYTAALQKFLSSFEIFAPAVQWTPFSSKDLQFSVSFCGVPSENPPAVEKKGAMTWTTRLFKALGENYFCMVATSEYNFKPDVEEELLLNQTNFIKAVNGTLGTSRRNEFVNAPEKLPALTFTFDMPPNHSGKSIVILKSSRVYQLVFTYRKNMDYTAAMQKFLSSFEIPK